MARNSCSAQISLLPTPSFEGEAPEPGPQTYVANILPKSVHDFYAEKKQHWRFKQGEYERDVQRLAQREQGTEDKENAAELEDAIVKRAHARAMEKYFAERLEALEHTPFSL